MEFRLFQSAPNSILCLNLSYLGDWNQYNLSAGQDFREKLIAVSIFPQQYNRVHIGGISDF